MGPSENWDVDTVQKYNVNCAHAKASQTHCQNNCKDHVSPSCEAGASVCNRGLIDMRSLTNKKIIIVKNKSLCALLISPMPDEGGSNGFI